MSIITITGISAVQFWLDFSKRINPKLYSYVSMERISLPPDYNVKISPASAELIADELGISLPLNVMVSSPASRHISKNIRFQLMPKALPKKSFVRLRQHHIPAGRRPCYPSQRWSPNQSHPARHGAAHTAMWLSQEPWPYRTAFAFKGRSDASFR